MAKITDWDGTVVHNKPVESHNKPAQLVLHSSLSFTPDWELKVTGCNVTHWIRIGKFITGPETVNWQEVAEEISRHVGFSNWEATWSNQI